MNSTSFDVSLAYTSFISDFSMYLFYKWMSLILSKLVSLVVVSDFILFWFHCRLSVIIAYACFSSGCQQFYPMLISTLVVSDSSLYLFHQRLSVILTCSYFISGCQ
jgi:hypothetical protein